MAEDDHRVKVFMTEDALAELEDKYDEKPEDLRKVVRDKIRELVKSAKMAKLQKTVIANIEVDEKKSENKQEQFPLKDFKLEKYVFKSDSDWLPKDFDEDDTKYYSIKVGSNTWKYLLMFCQLWGVRIEKWNDSLGKDDPKRKDKFMETPECREQILHEQLIPTITRELVNAVGDEFDDEFKEIDKAESAKKKKDKKGKEPKEEGSKKEKKKPEKTVD